ncbi:MAG: hypothetical protein ABJL99_20700 [Aliishimia sp.]
MSRKTWLTSIDLIDLAVGFMGRGAFENPGDRGRAMAELFETYCLPMMDGEIVPPGTNLVKINAPSNSTWGTTHTQILLSRKDRQCSVSDVLRPMTQTEVATFEAQVTQIIEADFPVLELDRQTGIRIDFFKVWAQFERTNPNRWGVTLVLPGFVGTQGETTLNMGLPRTLPD